MSRGDSSASCRNGSARRFSDWPIVSGGRHASRPLSSLSMPQARQRAAIRPWQINLARAAAVAADK